MATDVSSALSQLIAFLQKYHDAVFAHETTALAALNSNDSDCYLKEMRLKAESMAALQASVEPQLEGLPEDLSEELWHAVHRFSNSARMGLSLNSPFYWSALLWNDDAKPGDKDNLQLFIDGLKNRI